MLGGPTMFTFQLDGQKVTATMSASGASSALTLADGTNVLFQNAGSTPTGQGLSYFCQ